MRNPPGRDSRLSVCLSVSQVDGIKEERQKGTKARDKGRTFAHLHLKSELAAPPGERETDRQRKEQEDQPKVTTPKDPYTQRDMHKRRKTRMRVERQITRKRATHNAWRERNETQKGRTGAKKLSSQISAPLRCFSSFSFLPFPLRSSFISFFYH